MSYKVYDTTRVIGVGTYPYAPPKQYVYHYQNGVNTPYSLLKEGRLRENIYTAQGRIETEAQTLVWMYDNPARAYERSSSYYRTGLSIPEPAYPLRIDVVPKLLEKWRNSDFNVGVTVLEGRESARMVANRLISLANAARDLKKRNLSGAIGHLMGPVPRSSKRRAGRKLTSYDISGAWLELQYGWLPMVKDIYSLSEALKVQGRKNRISAYSKNEILTGTVNVGKVDVHQNEKRLHMIVDCDHTPSMAERFGLTDPLTIAWELVPFSFVVDWFLPIGDTLEALHAVRALPATQCIETKVWKQKYDHTVAVGTYANNHRVIRWDSPHEEEYWYHNRVVGLNYLSTWSIVSQIPRSIKPKWDWDIKRVANAAALLHQRFKLF